MERREEILGQLKKAGYKFTGKRKRIVEIFVEHRDKYVTAKDVYNMVSEEYPNVSFDTIYRTLSLLLELELIEKLEFNDEATKYRLACGHGDHHHHHLVCLNCGKIMSLEGCPMKFLPDQFDSFTVTNHRFEIYGYCSSCEVPHQGVEYKSE